MKRSLAGILSASLCLAGCSQAVTSSESESVIAYEDQSFDVVIVGGGLAGLMAANELADNYPDQKVVLLEKSSSLGGNLPYTGGVIMGFSEDTYKGSQSHPVADADTYVALFDHTISELENYGILEEGEYVNNDKIIYNSFSVFQEAVDRMFDAGVDFPETWEEYGVNVLENFHSIEAGEGYGETAFDFTEKIIAYTQNKNIEIRMNSNVSELLVSDGVVSGVTVTTDDGVYTISSDHVLLATGGFANNEEYMAQYNADYAGVDVLSTGKSTGDAISLTRQFDTPVVGAGLFGGIVSNDSTWEGLKSYFMVDENGERFVDESSTPYIQFAAIHKLRNGQCWTICDSTYAETHEEEIQLKLEEGDLVSYDSLEELCSDQGIDLEGLQATIAEYNAAVENQETLEYGLDVSYANPILKAPFYAEKNADYCFETIPGIQINEDMQVLNGSGDIVKGLYAAGEAVYGNVVTQMYPQSGSGLSFSAASGTYAAKAMMKE